MTYYTLDNTNFVGSHYMVRDFFPPRSDDSAHSEEVLNCSEKTLELLQGE